MFRYCFQKSSYNWKDYARRRKRKGMNPQLYRAAQRGNWDIMKIYGDCFYTQQTANRSTVLHVLAQWCSTSGAGYAAQQILEREPHLLLALNEQKETALHLAARKGHLEVVRALTDEAKGPKDDWKFGNLRGKTDVDGNTALHQAVGNNHDQVVKLLLEEDPEFKYKANIAGESPLYIAAEKAYHDIVALILSTCKSPSYEGPGKSTALHAAAIRNCPECVEQILKKFPHVLEKVDKIGWTALHYAAKYNHHQVVKLLLSKDKFIAYVLATKDDSKTALHVAATHGHQDVIKEILLNFPDCWEGTTRKRHNILHLAVQNEQGEVLEFILKNPWAVDLINQKDDDGNTPLHLYVATKELQGNSLLKLSGVDMNPFNNAGLTPLGMIFENEEVTDRQRSIRDELKQAGAILRMRKVKPSIWDEVKQAATGASLGMQNATTIQFQDKPNSIDEDAKEYTVVAALIITVTFAACLTIPGGYQSGEGPNQGKAVLVNNAAFQTFIVSDTLALVSSFIAVLLRLRLVGNKNQPEKFAVLCNARLYLALAMLFMYIAFLSGVYAVIPTKKISAYLPNGSPYLVLFLFVLIVREFLHVHRLKLVADRLTSKY